MSEIDPELDATWRAASREQPPTALDDAIRAAARREAGAKPGRLRAAPRWLPFAAAATVAAIAVGIVQMTPPEQVTPAAIPAATHTASDAARREAKADTEQPSADRPQRQAPSVAPAPEAQRDAAKPMAKEQRRGAVDENDRDVLARNRSDGFAGAPRKAFQEKKVLAPGQEPQRMEESERAQDFKQKTELAAASSAARPNPAVSARPASSVARNEPQPFPATPAPAESGATKVPPQMAAAAPPPAPASAAAPAPMLAERKFAAQSSATGALSDNRAGKSADDIAAVGRMSNAEPAQAQGANALEKRKADMADKAPLERRKDSAPLAPDEWIKRIRRLIAEGKNEDAARELLAFRREYRERSESLLPGDLRAFKP